MGGEGFGWWVPKEAIEGLKAKHPAGGGMVSGGRSPQRWEIITIFQ